MPNFINIIRLMALFVAFYCNEAISKPLLDLSSIGTLTYETTTEENGDLWFVVAPHDANSGLKFDHLEGETAQYTYEISGDKTTDQVSQLIKPLLEQLNFNVVLDCINQRCGGFDFRQSVDLAPPPAFYFNLSDFRVITARRGKADAINLVISRINNATYIQISQIIGSNDFTSLKPKRIENKLAVTLQNDSLEQQLLKNGYAILEGLEYESASARLDKKSFASIYDLAQFMTKYPNAYITLVGHSDTDGSLTSNIILSEKRADAVMMRLVEKFAISDKRLSVKGVGYLSPRATNQTENGKEKNRRVEAVLENFSAN